MLDVAARSRALSVERRAVLAIVGAVFLWSGCSLFVRAGHTDALVFTTWRLWLALPPLGLLVLVRARRATAVALFPPDVPRGRWILLMFGAGAFFVSGAVTAFAAIGMTRLLDVTLIGALQPIAIIAFAVAFLGEVVQRSNIGRAVVAIGATIVVALAASSTGTWSLSGDLVAVASLFLNAGWFLYGRVGRTNLRKDPFAFIGRGVFFATCVMLAGTTAHVLMVWAHRYIPTSVSSPLLLGEAPLVAAGAWICFGEALGPIEIIGSAVVVGALWGVVRSPELEHAEHDVPDPGPPA
jgi:drug/metabolite transporter (DMT)-like permease